MEADSQPEVMTHEETQENPVDLVGDAGEGEFEDAKVEGIGLAGDDNSTQDACGSPS